MKVDKQKLIELLMKKTGMEKNEIESQLDQLIERILDAGNQGKALEIKDFGIFFFDESGDLNFNPSDVLSAEISFKYAGMKPVVIQGDRDTSISSDDLDLEGKSDSTDDKADADDINSEHDSLSQEWSNFRKPLKIELDDDYIANEDQADDDIDDLPDLSFPQKSPNQDTYRSPSVRYRYASKRSRNNASIWLFVAILLIALIASGIYIWYMNTSSPPQELQTVITPQAQPDTQELTDITGETDQSQMSVTDEESETDSAAEMEPTSETAVQELRPQQLMIPADQPLHGLMGVNNQNLRNSYSIVLHAFTDERVATNTANQLAMEGYRTQVTARNVANSTMWRVSVGQFETLNEAQNVAGALPSPYNTQNFIHRIE